MTTSEQPVDAAVPPPAPTPGSPASSGAPTSSTSSTSSTSFDPSPGGTTDSTTVVTLDATSDATAETAAGPTPIGEHAIVRGLWRGVDVFRCLALVYAVYSVWSRRDEILHPTGAVVVLVALAVWTVAQTVRPVRTARAYGFELALACVAVLGTRLIDSEAVITAGAKTIPSIWPAAAVIGFAILRGWRGGLLSAALVTLCVFIEIGTPTGNTVNNSVFLFLLGGCVGYCVDLARESHTALAEAMRRDAARAERDRLARTVHDGVLQTLSFIHRRGGDLGGQSAVLGAMAGEQERILRTLVSQGDLGEVDRAVAGDADLRASLRHVERDEVALIAPAAPIVLPRRVADEVVAAVEAALDNVRKHAGEAARTWVLLDDDGDGVSVTIRDSGQGLREGRLEEAARQGRLGVASSIRGRLADLGGTASISSGPTGGTTVELRIPTGAP